MKPILFNTEMVRAILDGRKTVTRRVVKLPTGYELIGTSKEISENIALFGEDDLFYCDETTNKSIKPKYQIGDIFYVRETWKKYTKRVGDGENCHPEDFIAYKADENRSDYPSEYFEEKWRPSIHMPKESARIFLKVTDIRVERLQDITPHQILKEGVIDVNKKAFSEIWNSTIKNKNLDEYGWDANPWVWVYEFERCEKPEVQDDKN